MHKPNLSPDAQVAGERPRQKRTPAPARRSRGSWPLAALLALVGGCDASKVADDGSIKASGDAGPSCGDGRVEGDEACDPTSSLGAEVACTSDCRVRAGFVCGRSPPGRCAPVCGDGLTVASEPCDDANRADGDGCSAACGVERGFTCDEGGCSPTCGDGLTRAGEACDDGNALSGDGCSSSCRDEARWQRLRGQSQPGPRRGGVAEWTGDRVLIWSGGRGLGTAVPDGATLDPAEGVWLSMAHEGAPRPRLYPLWVSTGQEIMIWGGLGATDPLTEFTPVHGGARFELASETWKPMNGDGGPDLVWGSAVWTGREMIVWGWVLNGEEVARAGRYDPETDSWSPVSELGAPALRAAHSAVWTGREMIIWGGWNFTGDFQDGALYDPATDSWRPVSSDGAPSPRFGQSTAWTGTEMIVWGGDSYSQASSPRDGAMYSPASDSWRPMSSVGAPPPGVGNLVVWTGSEMLVWGGAVPADEAASYIPAVDSWVPISPEGAPADRGEPSGVWTGTELFVWGGMNELTSLGDGGFYSPTERRWRTLEPIPLPSGRSLHTAEWTGSEVLIFGGCSDLCAFNDLPGLGWVYTASQERWRPMAGGEIQELRILHSSVWTGSEMIIWGGDGDLVQQSPRDDGLRWDRDADALLPVSRVGAPSPRSAHTAVWTGREMIVFGGSGSGQPVAERDGGLYDPTEDAWRPLPTTEILSPRMGHSAVWTGFEMLVFGGARGREPGYDTRILFTDFVGDGARFDPVTGLWRTISAEGAPSARAQHVAVWTGTEMIIWGGRGPRGTLVDGASYDPALDRWTPLPDGPLTGRYAQSSVWTGTELWIYGGWAEGQALTDGARYDPTRQVWAPLPRHGAPAPRGTHTAVWADGAMIVFGGSGYDFSHHSDGFVLTPGE